MIKALYMDPADPLQARQKGQSRLFDALFRLKLSRYKQYSSTLFEMLIQTDFFLFLNMINISQKLSPPD